MNCVSATASGRTNRKALKKGFRPEITVVSAKPMMSNLAADAGNLLKAGNRSSVLCGEVEIPPPPQLPPPPRPSGMAAPPPKPEKEQIKTLQKTTKTAVEKTKTMVEKSMTSVPAIPKRPAPTVIKPTTKSTLQSKAEDKIKKAAVAYATKAVIEGVKDEMGISKSAPSRPAPPPPATKKADISPPRSPTRHAPKKPSKYHSLERKAAPPSQPKMARSATLPSKTEKNAPSRPQTLPLVTEFKPEMMLPSPRKSLRPTILTAAGALPIKQRKTESEQLDTKPAASPLKDNTSFANNCNSPVTPNTESREGKKPPPVKTKPVIPRKPSLDALPQVIKISSPNKTTVDYSAIIQVPEAMHKDVNGSHEDIPKSSYFSADESPEETNTRSRSPSPKSDHPKKPPRIVPGRTNLKKSKSLVVRRRHVSPPSSPPPPPKSPKNRTASFSTSPTHNTLDDGIRSRHLRRSKSNIGPSDHRVVEKRNSSPKSKPARPRTGPYMLKSDDELNDNGHENKTEINGNIDTVTHGSNTVAIDPNDDMKPIKPTRPAPPVRNTSITTPVEDEKESSFMSDLKAKLDVSQPHALATANHQAANDKELSYMIGDIIFLSRKINSDYYFGKIDDKTGIVSVKSIEVFIDVDQSNTDQDDSLLDVDGPTEDLPIAELEDPHAIVVHRYIASNENELTLNPGDVVKLECKCDNDMLKGSANGQSGVFPTSFVAIVVPLSKCKESLRKLSIAMQDDIIGPRCQSVFDFDSGVTGDLAFPKGETIKLLEVVNEEWLKGEYNGVVGLFPKAYVDIIEDLPEEIVSMPHEEVPILYHAKALYDFQGAHPNELSFMAGDIVSVTSVVSDDWLEGEIAGHTGMFPVSFVKRITEEGEIEQEDDIDNIPGSDDMSPKAKALHDFSAMQDEELSFPAGAVVYLTKTLDSGWYEGEYDGKVGIFPAKFIEVITPLPDFL